MTDVTCRCLKPADALRRTLEGLDVEPCPLHAPLDGMRMPLNASTDTIRARLGIPAPDGDGPAAA